MREMKDSGNRWIGSIPKWWDIDRFKHCVTMYTGNSIKDEQKNNYIDSVDAKPYISSKDINRVFSTIDYDNGLYIKNTDFSFRIAYKNDILMCIEGGSAGKKKAQLDRNVGFVNKLCCFHSKNKFIFPRFLFYYLSNPAYEDEFLYNITGMIGGVSVGKLGEFQIVLPPYEEQKAIADFLDMECKKIDEIMADVQSQIDALEDYKKSVISEAVTKGLNPNAELKDSGVEWIGEIPCSWEIIKIAGLYSLRNTKVSDFDYPPLSVTMQGILPQIDTAAKTNDHGNRKLVKRGDFAINSRSDRRGSCGISEFDGSVSLINTVLKPSRKMENRYYNWLFHTPLFADEFYKWGHGIVDDLWTTTWQDMKKITVPYPSTDEQSQIADYLDKKCADIDSVIADKKSQLDTLEEYKKSLIYEYVTGKKEVSAV